MQSLEEIYNRITFNKTLLLLSLLKQRVRASTLIQSRFRGYFRRTEMKNFLRKKRNYYLLPFYAPPETIAHQVYLEIVHPEFYKSKYLCQLCKFKKLFIACLPKEKYRLLKTGILHFRFIENGKLCIDPHYEINSDLHLGLFYNSIDLEHYNFLEEMEMIKLKNFAKKIVLNEKEHVYKNSRKKSEVIKITKHLKKFINSNPIMAK